MTELEDKATRRAQRRGQQQISNPGAEGTPESAQAPEDVGARAEVVADSSSGSDNPPAPKVEQIRDRNARLRAQAAEERRAKRERERATVAVPMGLDASERMDDLFVRTTHAAAGWLRKNFRWLQWVVIASVLGGFGLQGYRYVAKSKAAESADALAVGLVAEGGSVRPASGDESKSVNPELEQLDPRPVYDSEEARTGAAEQGYRKAIAGYGESGAGWLARLGLAGLLYDQEKWDEAIGLYRSVRASELAKQDPDVLARSIEGIGLALEGKGDKDAALQAFRELTNQEGAPSLATLGLYHQARLLLEKGEKDKAKELALKAKERLDKDAQPPGKDKDAAPKRPSYLGESVKMLLARIDPSSGAATRNIGDMLRDDPSKLQKMLEGLKSQPAAPVETPETPASQEPGEAP